MNVCSDPSLLANQLSYIELERIKNISPDEFLNFYMTSQLNLTQPTSEFEKISDVCNKNYRVYLNELKQACQGDILIKKTKYADYSFKRTSSLLAYNVWFNRISWFICSQIVKSLDMEQRVKIINFFIDVADNCLMIRNYNCVFAITGIFVAKKIYFNNYIYLAGLQSYSISRLKQTVLC